MTDEVKRAMFGGDDEWWVPAADFDRVCGERDALREERDRMIEVSAANIATTQRNMDALKAAGRDLAVQLAIALTCWKDKGPEAESEGAAALAAWRRTGGQNDG